MIGHSLKMTWQRGRWRRGTPWALVGAAYGLAAREKGFEVHWNQGDVDFAMRRGRINEPLSRGDMSKSDAAMPILFKLLKAEMTDRKVRSIHL